MEHSEHINELAGALAKAQGQMATAKRNAKNPFLKSEYADLTAVWEAARNALTANELSIFQPADIDEQGAVTVTTLLGHSSGQWMSSILSMTPSAEKGLSMAQVMGKIVSYLRRYGLMSLVGITVEGEDDDGSGAKGKVTPKRKPAPKRADRGQAEAMHWIDNENTRKAFWARANELSLTNTDVYAALEVDSIHKFTGTLAEAGAKIVAWLHLQTEPLDDRVLQEALGAHLDGGEAS